MRRKSSLYLGHILPILFFNYMQGFQTGSKHYSVTSSGLKQRATKREIRINAGLGPASFSSWYWVSYSGSGPF